MEPEEKEHKCKPYITADWSHLRCECGQKYLPGEGPLEDRKTDNPYTDKRRKSLTN